MVATAPETHIAAVPETAVASFTFSATAVTLQVHNGATRNGILSSKYTDDETDLVYYGYRYYSPEMGRWMSRDPLGRRGGANESLFCANLVTGAVDPLGLVTLRFVGDGPKYRVPAKRNGRAVGVMFYVGVALYPGKGLKDGFTISKRSGEVVVERQNRTVVSEAFSYQIANPFHIGQDGGYYGEGAGYGGAHRMGSGKDEVWALEYVELLNYFAHRCSAGTLNLTWEYEVFATESPEEVLKKHWRFGDAGLDIPKSEDNEIAHKYHWFIVGQVGHTGLRPASVGVVSLELVWDYFPSAEAGMESLTISHVSDPLSHDDILPGPQRGRPRTDYNDPSAKSELMSRLNPGGSPSQWVLPDGAFDIEE